MWSVRCWQRAKDATEMRQRLPTSRRPDAVGQDAVGHDLPFLSRRPRGAAPPRPTPLRPVRCSSGDALADRSLVVKEVGALQDAVRRTAGYENSPAATSDTTTAGTKTRTTRALATPSDGRGRGSPYQKDEVHVPPQPTACCSSEAALGATHGHGTGESATDLPEPLPAHPRQILGPG